MCRFSRYAPPATRTLSSAAAASIPPWMVRYGCAGDPSSIPVRLSSSTQMVPARSACAEKSAHSNTDRTTSRISQPLSGSGIVAGFIIRIRARPRQIIRANPAPAQASITLRERGLSLKAWPFPIDTASLTAAESAELRRNGFFAEIAGPHRRAASRHDHFAEAGAVFGRGPGRRFSGSDPVLGGPFGHGAAPGYGP